MNRRAWGTGGHLKPAWVAHLSGTHHPREAGTECTLRLVLRPDGQLSGELTTEGERLGLVGGISALTHQGYGFLLEPQGHAVIAIFRVVLEAAGFTLELDVPDFSERLILHHAQQVAFERTTPPEEPRSAGPTPEHPRTKESP